MNPENSAEIELLLKAALERQSEEREAFLRQACGDNETLRARVAILIAAKEHGDRFDNSGGYYQVGPEGAPSGTGRVEPLMEGSDQSLAGRAVGQYRVIREIGKGGMGVVYLARDRLGSHVALKFLPAEFVKDENRLRRFKQEARAARAVTHPNIVSIYETGQEGDHHYIVTEFIEGENLREHMKRAKMRIPEVITVAIEIATALEAAHARGIVHRDIKPGNVMIHPAGYVKLLDFGLAKLLKDDTREPAGPDLSTVTDMNTGSWSRMGTPQYMSPEQLLGEDIDGRTDIWSLGVMMYEMLAGTRPFGRDSTSIAEGALDFPPDLQRIVMKALRKDRRERYQTAREILEDLKSLQRDADSGVTTLHLASVTGDDVAGAGTAGPNKAVQVERSPRFDSASVNTGPSIATFRVRTRRFRRAAIVVILLSFVFAISMVIRLVLHSSHPPRNIARAVISPDGKYTAAIILSDDGTQSISLDSTNTSETKTVPGAYSAYRPIYRGLCFSPDSDYLYYLIEDKDKTCSSWRVSVVGVSVEPVAEKVATPVAFSPYGERMAFVRKGEHRTDLVTSDLKGAGERSVVVLAAQKQFATFTDFDNNLAWLPDGKHIACITLTEGDSLMDVEDVDIDDGTMRKIIPRQWYTIAQIVSVPNCKVLLMTAAETFESGFELWRIDYERGEVDSLGKGGSGNPLFISVTQDGGILLTTRITTVSKIYVVPTGDAERKSSQASGAYDEAIPSTDGRGGVGIAWTPNDRLIYTAATEGNTDIWSMDINGEHRKRLTDEPAPDAHPSVSSDGKIAFTSERDGRNQVWVMNGDGSRIPLASGVNADSPQISRDGKWVVYGNDDRIWKVSTSTGEFEPVHLAYRKARYPVVSPNGEWIACYAQNGVEVRVIAVIPFAGSDPDKDREISIRPGVNEMGGLRWHPSGEALTYIGKINGVSNIWSQSLTGSQAPLPVTDFKPGRILAFDWSYNATRLACVRETTIGIMVSEHLYHGFRAP